MLLMPNRLAFCSGSEPQAKGVSALEVSLLSLALLALKLRAIVNRDEDIQ